MYICVVIGLNYLPWYNIFCLCSSSHTIVYVHLFFFWFCLNMMDIEDINIYIFNRMRTVSGQSILNIFDDEHEFVSVLFLVVKNPE